MAVTAGQRVTALMFGQTKSDSQNAAATTTSTSYTSTLTGGTACGVAFVAPTSGEVIIHNSAFMDNSSTGRSYVSWIIREGDSIGSGATFLDGGDESYIAELGSNDVTAGRAIHVTGLTPGASYNCQQQFKTSAATTASYSWRHLIVQPVP